MVLDQPDANETAMRTNKVGLSVFYDCIDLSPSDEKQDKMKTDRSDTEEESEFCNNNKKTIKTVLTLMFCLQCYSMESSTLFFSIGLHQFVYFIQFLFSLFNVQQAHNWILKTTLSYIKYLI